MASPRRSFAVVTGATGGFGAAVTTYLACSGWDVCIVVRNPDRAAALVAEVRAVAPEASLDVVVADLSSIGEVNRAADEILELDRPLDLLVNNAGAVSGMRRSESIDGIEMTMALNHFSYHQLSVRLLGRISEAVRGRIVVVASNAYEGAGGRFDFDNWDGSRKYRLDRQYAMSKLANILFTRELASRVDKDGIEVVAWSPTGLTATRFGNSAHRLAPLAMKLTRPFSLSTDVAVAGLLDLCDRPLSPAEQGAFFVGDEIDPADVATTQDAARLWDMTTRILEATRPLA